MAYFQNIIIFVDEKVFADLIYGWKYLLRPFQWTNQRKKTIDDSVLLRSIHINNQNAWHIVE